MIAEGLDEELARYEKTFLNMAFIQSEDLVDQEHAVRYVTEMNELAISSGRRRRGVDCDVPWCEGRRGTAKRCGRALPQCGLGEGVHAGRGGISAGAASWHGLGGFNTQGTPTTHQSSG